MTWDRQHSLLQNVAAIAAEFHTHQAYWEFYERFGKHIDGFIGQYELCIEMAKALTDWEGNNGRAHAYDNAGAPWIEIVEAFVSEVISMALDTGECFIRGLASFCLSGCFSKGPRIDRRSSTDTTYRRQERQAET